MDIATREKSYLSKASSGLNDLTGLKNYLFTPRMERYRYQDTHTLINNKSPNAVIKTFDHADWHCGSSHWVRTKNFFHLSDLSSSSISNYPVVTLTWCAVHALLSSQDP